MLFLLSNASNATPLVHGMDRKTKAPHKDRTLLPQWLGHRHGMGPRHRRHCPKIWDAGMKFLFVADAQ